ncbi:MAG: hypothetical protein PUI94_03840 [Eubacteriales bacterium]|nr:hypothetical protein [Eubacteriales bacterium]
MGNFIFTLVPSFILLVTVAVAFERSFSLSLAFLSPTDVGFTVFGSKPLPLSLIST